MSSLLLCFILVAGVCRADFVVGVKPGDWVKYNVENNKQNGLPTRYWINVTVLSVSGTIVSLHGETNVNETTPYNWTEDIAYDCVGGKHFHDLPYVIPANLSAGDIILEGYIGGGATITDTVQRSGRDTVHVKTDYDDTYWEREKGVLLEYDYNATDGTMTMKIAGTNMWSSGFLGLGLDWWVWAIVVVVVVLAAVTGAVLIVRRKRQARGPSTQHDNLSTTPSLPRD